MRKLLSWVKSGEGGAVGVVHIDRLSYRMGQMAQIMDTLRDNDVELLVKNSPLQAGTLGEGMALVMTLAKAFQVERADEGSKTGLHNRAKLRGLPTTCQAPCSYRWDETRARLLCTTNWENRKLILKSFLNGAPINGIRRELHKRIISSPTGLAWWPQSTIWGILVDSVNCSKYRALRRENTEPEERRGKRSGEPTYGKTSSRRLPGIPMPKIRVEKPIITREEQHWILRRLEQNRLNTKQTVISFNSTASFGKPLNDIPCPHGLAMEALANSWLIVANGVETHQYIEARPTFSKAENKQV